MYQYPVWHIKKIEYYLYYTVNRLFRLYNLTCLYKSIGETKHDSMFCTHILDQKVHITAQVIILEVEL
jgi:hypothetical protein